MVALSERGHTGSAIDHHASTLVAENGGKNAFGIGARSGEFVGVAKAGRLDFDQDLALSRTVQLNRFDR